jgi:hypothetical protein
LVGNQLLSPTKVKHPNSFRNYWFGYVYGLFWGFVTFSCATHAILLIATIQTIPSDIEKRAALFTQMFLWPVSTIFFAWATIRLLLGKAGLTLVATLVVLHALNVLAKGISINDLTWWMTLSAIALWGFKERAVKLEI